MRAHKKPSLVAFVANGKLGVFQAFKPKTKSVGRSIAQFILATLMRLVHKEGFEKQFNDLLPIAKKPTKQKIQKDRSIVPGYI